MAFTWNSLLSNCVRAVDA